MPALPAFDHTVTARFLRYVTIDTQSDPESLSTPSTEKQKNLGRVLLEELREAGLSDAAMDAHGYVYATLPANSAKVVPVICFCSHMDTSPDCSGAGVKPQLVRNYQGGDITLPGDSTQVIRAAEHPALARQIGNDIVTTDGTTLLGADNKAGLAEIVDAMRYLVKNPQVRHGEIKVLHRHMASKPLAETARLDRRHDDDALAIIRQMPAQVSEPELWWGELNVMSRRALEKAAGLADNAPWNRKH